MPDGGEPVSGRQCGTSDSVTPGRSPLTVSLVVLMLTGAWLAVDLLRSLQFPLLRAASPIEGERFDPRMASVAEWTLVPGIGPALGRKLHQTRPGRGAWSLVEVPGIGPVTARRAAAYLRTTRSSDSMASFVDEGASSTPLRTKAGSS